MDPFRFTTLAHATHDFCNPVSIEALDRCVAELELPAGSRVLDAGCGKAELLIRFAERWNARAVGVDMNPAFLAEARKRAAGRAELELIESPMADARFEPGSFALAICVGSVHVFGDLPQALAALRALLVPGGRLLLGHGYWQREPDPEYLAGFDATRDELGSHADNLAALAAAGFETTGFTLSSPADWDEYENRYSGNVERFFAEHPNDPDRDEFLARIRSWHALYRRWGRDTMGFALYRARRG